MSPAEATRKLLATAQSASLEKVQALLDASADPNAEDEDGKSALDLACASGNTAVIKILEEAQDLLAAGAGKRQYRGSQGFGRGLGQCPQL